MAMADRTWLLLTISRTRSRFASDNVFCPHLSRSEEHTSELQSPCNLVCRLLLEKKKLQVLTLNLYYYAVTSDVIAKISAIYAVCCLQISLLLKMSAPLAILEMFTIHDAVHADR